MDDYAARLNRIETKLDNLVEGQSQAFIAFAGLEEKVVANKQRTDRLEWRLDEYEGDLDSIKGLVGYNSQSTKTAERFIWLLISAIIGAIAYGFRA